MQALLDQYERSMRAIYPQLSSEAIAYTLAGIQVVEYPKRSFVIEYGKLQHYLLFVAKGLLRGFYINDKGEEITIRFVREDGYATHYSALLQQRPSQYAFQCLEACTLLELPFQHIQEGYQQFRSLDTFGRKIAEYILIGQQQRIESFQFLSAEARYLQFVEQYPNLFHRVSLSHLSSYLGIQRPSLSRIRKKLAQQ